MAKTFALPSRQIHLDFHTSPAILDVGANFNAREFARTMKEANVNSVTLFAKCHHGHLYYNTKHPARHPGLKKGLDLLRKQVDALHDQGIRAPIYLSVQCDEFAANTHPEWIARNADGTNVGAKPVQDPFPNYLWQILDMSSPYQDYLAQQTEEVLRQFKPVDGIFFDMCWDQPSVSRYAKQGMKKVGLNPASEAERSVYAHQVTLAYMKRLHGIIKASSAEASVYFNSRPLANIAEESPYMTQVEIEALPTGFWGYLYFPKNVRFVRGFDRPYMGMTARFHKSWADFGGLKPYPALEYETSQMMAHGAQCSIGDQMHPRGFLDKASYELIGRAYQRVADREPWLAGARPVTQIGVWRTVTKEYNAVAPSDDGITRMLTQLKHQFDFIASPKQMKQYELIILPDGIDVDQALARELRAYLKTGGKLLLSGKSGMSAALDGVVFPEIGVKPEGMSPFTSTYIRFGKDISEGVAPADHVMYEKGVRVRPAKGTRVLAAILEPYFERTWEHFSSHCQTPFDKVSPFPAATINKGVAYISYPVFAAFGLHASPAYRQLVGNVIDLLLPEPLLCLDAPTSTETSVMLQGKRTIVHMLQYCPERRGSTGIDLVEDIVPLYDVAVSLKLDKAPTRVYVAPEEENLEFRYEDGRCLVFVPEVAGHAMIVFE